MFDPKLEVTFLCLGFESLLVAMIVSKKKKKKKSHFCVENHYSSQLVMFKVLFRSETIVVDGIRVVRIRVRIRVRVIIK